MLLDYPRQFEELLRNDDFVKSLKIFAKEVGHYPNQDASTAWSYVLSAIADPEIIARIHSRWFAAEENGKFGLKRYVRWRVYDKLRKEGRRKHHCALPETPEAIEAIRARVPGDPPMPDPRAQLESEQVRLAIRSALDCFAMQGRIQKRQADLLRQHYLDGMAYIELSTETGSSRGALRVRVFKATAAFRSHIERCHPGLVELRGR